MLETYASIIISLFIIEVLLSIDNALVNATLAEGLPEEQRKKAIRIGILLGAVFRIFALFLASIIIQNVWLKILGGAYLIYLAIAHLGKMVDNEGHTVRSTKDSFRAVIVQIALADIVFSIDNVISAVSFSSNIYIVIFGVGVGEHRHDVVGQRGGRDIDILRNSSLQHVAHGSTAPQGGSSPHFT
jgi:predicted tellurium resistance membrane protein TerC